MLRWLAWSYSAAPTGGRLTVQDGATTILDFSITAAGPRSLPSGGPPARLGLKGSLNTAMTVTLAAGGAAVSGKVNAYKRTMGEP